MTGPAVPPSLQLLLEEIATRALAGGVPVGDGGQPEDVGDGPWIVVWPDAGVLSAHTLGRPRSRVTAVLTAHCVGRSPESARVAARVLAGVLVGMGGADVAGWRVQPPEQLSALPLSIDRDVKPPLYTQTAEWRLRLTPTT